MLIQQRHRWFRLAQQIKVNRWQALVVHAPAVVAVLVHRHLDDFASNNLVAPGLLERARQVEPVQAEHHIGSTQHGLRGRREE